MVMVGDVVRGALHNRGPSWCSVFDGGVEACHLFTCTLNTTSAPTSKYAHASFLKSASRRPFDNTSPSGHFQRRRDCAATTMSSLLGVHLEQIALCCQGIDSLPCVPITASPSVLADGLKQISPAENIHQCSSLQRRHYIPDPRHRATRTRPLLRAATPTASFRTTEPRPEARCVLFRPAEDRIRRILGRGDDIRRPEARC
jgi:hypothetical protein